MDCFSSPPPPPRDHMLNMPPTPSHPLNPSSSDLVKEINTLEVKIVHLERYLLSMYRTSFQKTIPSNLGHHGSHIQQMAGIQPLVTSDLSSRRTMSEVSKGYCEHQRCSSPTSALTGPTDTVPFTTPKSSFARERKSAYFRRRSLVDHLGNFCVGDACIFPDKLSEDILRCISDIYCKVGNSVRSHQVYSVSSNSSFCSSGTFSPRNLSGSWSPQCHDEVSENYNIEGLKQDNDPYAAMVEVLKICLDDESYSYAAIMLQKFRSLVKSLENLDMKKMRHEQKLAFWINIHNALMMHAHLAYENQNYTKSTSITKAAYNVGGLCVTAYDIQSSILGIKSHYSAPWLQTLLLSPRRKFKTVVSRHAYAIDYPEPLVHFALSSGARSDPAIRIYYAKSIFEDLNIAKEEFIQATAYVHKQKRLYLPKILQFYAKDMSLSTAALLKVVGDCLPEYQQKSIDRFLKGRPEKCLCWLEESSSFRYLIHKEIAETAW